MKRYTRLGISKDNLSSILLFLGVIFAIIVSNNSLLFGYYKEFVNYKFNFGFGDYALKKTTLKFVNDGLMAIFFFFLGLEMKYHMTEGEFKDRKKLTLPTIMAIGGFIIPALLYVIINFKEPTYIGGWGISVATDTAFVLAILSLFGDKISNSTKIIVIGVSIIDDVLAVVVLAVFYTPELNLIQLLFCVFPLMFLTTLNLRKSYNRYLYYGGGALLWYFMVMAGVHGTIAGVILAFFVPSKIELFDRTIILVKDIESSLHSLVAFFILPLFAFVNCELPFVELSMNDLFSTLSIGCFIGLFIGKPLGIYGSYLGAKKLIKIELPQGCSELQFFAISCLCGIGFTISLFIGLLAIDPTILENEIKIGILLASFMSAIVGTTILKFAPKPELESTDLN